MINPAQLEKAAAIGIQKKRIREATDRDIMSASKQLAQQIYSQVKRSIQDLAQPPKIITTLERFDDFFEDPNSQSSVLELTCYATESASFTLRMDVAVFYPSRWPDGVQDYLCNSNAFAVFIYRGGPQLRHNQSFPAKELHLTISRTGILEKRSLDWHTYTHVTLDQFQAEVKSLLTEESVWELVSEL